MRLNIHLNPNGVFEDAETAVIVLSEAGDDGGGVVGGISRTGNGVWEAKINDPSKITGVDGLTGASVKDVWHAVQGAIAAGRVTLSR